MKAQISRSTEDRVYVIVNGVNLTQESSADILAAALAAVEAKHGPGWTLDRSTKDNSRTVSLRFTRKA